MEIKNNLLEIRETIGLSRQMVSNGADINFATLLAYELNKCQPSVENLLKLSKFYDTPIETFYKETIKDDQDTLIKSYEKNYEQACKEYIVTQAQHIYKRGMSDLEKENSLSLDLLSKIYPYNLISDIVGQPIYFINFQQYDALQHVLKELLTENERKILNYKYARQFTLKQISERLGENLTIESYRLTLLKLIKKLQTDYVITLITLGKDGYEAKKDLDSYRKAKQLQDYRDEIERYQQQGISPINSDVLPFKELTTKAQTILLKNEVNTFSDLVKFIEYPDKRKTERGLGPILLNEIKEFYNNLKNKKGIE